MTDRDTFVRPNVRPSGSRISALVAGTVEFGDQRGRELGFPTANLSLDADTTDDDAVGDGVWVATVTLADGTIHAATVSVGHRVTFYGREGIRLVESHLLDFHGDLYGQRVEVRLYSRLRLQRRFPDVDSLVEQMHKDVEDTRIWAATRIPSDGDRAVVGLS